MSADRDKTSGGDPDAPFGLLGRTLGHSWSPAIHSELGSAPYALFEREPDEVAAFVREGRWRGLNVTIPYKRDAARLADVRSERVERTGAANTLVRLADGRIFAENTDVLGFSRLLTDFFERSLGCSPKDALARRDVAVLGSGGASRAVVAALEDVGAEPHVISRSGEDNYENFLERHSHASLVVNTTPVGMYPNCPATPLSLETLSSMDGLLGVVDIVYNPIRTGLCLAAEKIGKPSESGLRMLVAQAVFSSELFQDTKLDDALIEKIFSKLSQSSQNIVLIGMPGCGKTTTGRRLARMLERPFVDIDEAIKARTGRACADIIREDGEGAFRAIETEVTGSYGAHSGLVVACGGGVVTRAENYDLIHQNGTIVMIDRPIEELSLKGRPISQDKGLGRIARERMGTYRSWADLVVASAGSPQANAKEIAHALNIGR